jgi:uncharacterized protein (DUF1810 family)
MTADGFQLDRFVTAQESTYQRAIDELRGHAGRLDREAGV